MKTFNKIFFSVVLAGLLMGFSAAYAESYATKRLARLDQTLRKNTPIREVTRRVNAYGEVEHIGIRLFPDAMRVMAPSPTYDFLERFLLETNIYHGIEQERLFMDCGMTFTVGNLATAMKIDTTYSYREEKIEYYRYRSTWSKDGKDVLQVVFRMNWQTMSGCSLDELEENFEKRLGRYEIVPLDTMPLKGNYIISPVFNNTLYVTGKKGKDGRRDYVFTPKQLSRSVSNLMLADDIPADVTLLMKVNRYDYITDTIAVPLRKYLSFCRAEEGCTPYFALKSRNGESMEGVLLCANRNGGFLHMLSVAIDEKVIEQGRGTVYGTLLPYIPLHNVRKEYLNLTEYESEK